MRFDRLGLVAVFAGGCLGALARAGVAEAFPPHAAHWPWATFVVNVAGAFALGWFAVRVGQRELQFLGAGVCGALTTFSTMQVELLLMLDASRYGLAAAYALVSVAAGYAAVAVAMRRTA